MVAGTPVSVSSTMKWLCEDCFLFSATRRAPARTMSVSPTDSQALKTLVVGESLDHSWWWRWPGWWWPCWCTLWDQIAWGTHRESHRDPREMETKTPTPQQSARCSTNDSSPVIRGYSKQHNISPRFKFWHVIENFCLIFFCVFLQNIIYYKIS